MFFPKRGCHTCKNRRVKCDRARPVCGQCQKAKVTCQGVVEDGNFIFLNENEYAGGSRKRRRGPNVTTTTTTTTTAPTMSTEALAIQGHFNTTMPLRTESTSGFSNDILNFGTSPTEPLDFHISPALDIPLDVQALAYYTRIHVEVPHGVPEVMDGHLKYALADWFQSKPDSILSLAISAVSHATFGRAQRSQAALNVGCAMYSRALVKTNMALKDANEVTHDSVLLSAMLLSFYENSVLDRVSQTSSRDIEAIGSRSFAHHDGAMALLKLRRQRGWPTNTNMELDKLVRRQLMRSLLLRSIPLPLWLRDGSKYGETGFALEMDRYMVIVAKLRHQASRLSKGPAKCSAPISDEKMAELRSFLAETQALDSALARWATILPAELQYRSIAVQQEPHIEIGDRSFNGTIHIYPTVGHAGLWNRYRALRLAVNALILRALSAVPVPLELDLNALKDAVKSIIYRLAEDLCESVPFTLDLIGTYQVDGKEQFFVTQNPTSLKGAIKASTAYFICWPLALVITIPDIPDRPRQYLRDRLLDVSEIVDDGVLERLAITSVHGIE
ncbi:hypothetical protein K505DRAFT_406770 [Melanomma pulvis-pyrius CBS 109.77]|uniref:Zn(2)-C6 fungal-type domain-containing protein n=1 Tax=Melanomma pulvis-pyrius CBS 109.77 TaxID=1314802 RepID=A0A6A6XIM2_9PLEO|nr:hypothetical protein K505DRAFT_406770 [Melanomma pulvis-pyrius CBS 109.77]